MRQKIPPLWKLIIAEVAGYLNVSMVLASVRIRIRLHFSVSVNVNVSVNFYSALVACESEALQ